MMKMFSGSLWVSLVGFCLAFWIGFREGGLPAAFSTLFLTVVLAVLEVSLSFDNAVVNASVLERMTELWRRRFLTWGILVAVFGMRLVLPLAIVAVMANVSPIGALVMALEDPKGYAAMMLSIHETVAAFGGTFLFMVGLEYFLNYEKDEHWLHWIEAPLARLGRIKSVEVILALIVVLTMAFFVSEPGRLSFLVAGISGIITFLIVDGLGAVLGGGDESVSQATIRDAHRVSLGLFLYLEVLDASFSFDGVIGAFALTQSLFLIAIGLGIGAMFVRSITIVLVERGTLQQFRYLEHGAFWAILSLAGLMYAGIFAHIPEVITGVCGALFIGSAVLSSRRAAPSV